MAIKFNVIERGTPGVVGGGNKKFYASAVTQGDVDITGLTRSIEKISTVSGADIRAVLYALVDVIADDLSEGRIVRMGELGSFRVSLSSEGLPTEKEVTASAVKGAHYLFTPGEKLKTALKTMTFTKA